MCGFLGSTGHRSLRRYNSRGPQMKEAPAETTGAPEKKVSTEVVTPFRDYGMGGGGTGTFSQRRIQSEGRVAPPSDA